MSGPMIDYLPTSTNTGANSADDLPCAGSDAEAVLEEPTHQEVVDHLEKNAPGLDWDTVTIRNATEWYCRFSDYKKSILGYHGVLGTLDILSRTDADSLTQQAGRWLSARSGIDRGNLKQLESLESMCFVLDEARKIHDLISMSIEDMEDTWTTFSTYREMRYQEITNPRRTALESLAHYIQSGLGVNITSDNGVNRLDCRLGDDWRKFVEHSNTLADALLRKIQIVEGAWETFDSLIRSSNKEGTSALRADPRSNRSGENLAKELAVLARTCRLKLYQIGWRP